MTNGDAGWLICYVHIGFGSGSVTHFPDRISIVALLMLGNLMPVSIVIDLASCGLMPHGVEGG